MGIAGWGALCFGFVIGWITYRTLRRKEGQALLSDISTVIAAVGGATVVGLFKDGDLFGAYSIGFFFGFALYFVIGFFVYGKDAANPWMGD